MKPVHKSIILQGQSELLRPPSGFTLQIPFQIRRQGSRYTHNFNIEDYKPTGQNYYVDVENGSDDNDGQTLETAFKTINKALTYHGAKSGVASVNSAIISTSTDWSASGTHSHLVQCPGSVADEGIKRKVDITTIIGHSYTATAKVWAPIGSVIKNVFKGTATVTITEQPQTITVQATATATAHGAAIRTGTSAQEIDFMVDEWSVVDDANPTVNLMTPFQYGAEPCIINLADGLYNKTNGFNDTEINNDVAILPISGTPIISAENSHTWTLTDGKTNTYQSSDASTIYRVLDSKTPDANGDYVEYTKKTSVDEVEATPGSWYQTGGVVYVHTTDTREADSDIHCYLAVKGVNATNLDVYLENIKIYGGGSSATTSSGPVYHASSGQLKNLYMKDCDVKYSINNNKGIFVSVSTAYLKNCISARNQSDGFNYHNAAKAYEVDCISRNNGYSGQSTENGSSAHEASQILRLNNKYHDNYGPNVIDIDANTLAWIVGCESKDSKATSTSGTDFYIDDGKMWLEGCSNPDSGSVYGLFATDDGSFYLRRNRVGGAVSGSYMNY